jgi:putative transposase
MAKVKSIEERNKELEPFGKKLKLYGLKLRIYPSVKQQELFNQILGIARFSYNFYLNEKIEIYQNTGETLNYTTFKKSFNQMKDHPLFDWLKIADKFAIENALMEVDTAFKNFFEGRARFPKKRKKHKAKQSYTTNSTNNNIKLDMQKFTVLLPKVGKVSFRINRKQKQLVEDTNGVIKSATVSRCSNGQHFVSIKMEEVVDIKKKPLVKEIEDKEIIGVDLGLTHFLITSNGKKIDNPRHYQRALVKLANLQRKLSKMQKGSNNYKKQKKEIARLHTKVKNMRHDFLHKVSRSLINENQVIVLEDLNVKGMIKNRKLAKSVQDVGWGLFKTFLSYKAEWDYKDVVFVDRFFPSSKNCNGCKSKNTLLSLNDREWVCPSCGCKHDRDINAAQNIKEEGIRLLKEEQKEIA